MASLDTLPSPRQCTAEKMIDMHQAKDTLSTMSPAVAKWDQYFDSSASQHPYLAHLWSVYKNVHIYDGLSQTIPGRVERVFHEMARLCQEREVALPEKDYLISTEEQMKASLETLDSALVSHVSRTGLAIIHRHLIFDLKLENLPDTPEELPGHLQSNPEITANISVLNLREKEIEYLSSSFTMCVFPRLTCVYLDAKKGSNKTFVTLPIDLFPHSKLTHFTARGHSLRSIPPDIGKKWRLTHLDLSHNKLTHLPPLEGLPIEEANFSYNRIQDIDPAFSWPTCKKLNLIGNVFQDQREDGGAPKKDRILALLKNNFPNAEILID